MFIFITIFLIKGLRDNNLLLHSFNNPFWGDKFLFYFPFFAGGTVAFKIQIFLKSVSYRPAALLLFVSPLFLILEINTEANLPFGPQNLWEKIANMLKLLYSLKLYGILACVLLENFQLWGKIYFPEFITIHKNHNDIRNNNLWVTHWAIIQK